MEPLTFDNSTYFGLFSRKQRTEVDSLLTALGVRYEFEEAHLTEQQLRDGMAWDDSSAGSLVGYDNFVHNDDLNILGMKLVELYPERK
jgi:hypothetical protein